MLVKIHHNISYFFVSLQKKNKREARKLEQPLGTLKTKKMDLWLSQICAWFFSLEKEKDYVLSYVLSRFPFSRGG